MPEHSLKEEWVSIRRNMCQEIFYKRQTRRAGRAPAKGLTLVSLEYETKLCPEIAVDNKYWKYRMIQQEIPEKKKE